MDGLEWRIILLAVAAIAIAITTGIATITKSDYQVCVSIVADLPKDQQVVQLEKCRPLMKAEWE